MNYDTILEIYNYLNLKDIYSCALINKEYNFVTYDDTIWKRLASIIIPNDILLKIFRNTYRDTYKRYFTMNTLIEKMNFINEKTDNIIRSGKIHVSQLNLNLLKEISDLFDINELFLDLNIKYGNKMSLDAMMHPDIEKKYFNNSLQKLKKNYNYDNYYITFTELPYEVYNFNSLQCLDLSDTNLTNLPSGIGKIVTLKELNISNNQICKLPDELNQLINIEILIIENNQIIKLFKNFKNLTKLTTLWAGNNKLNKLSELKYCTNLKVLYLNNNKIKSIKDVAYNHKLELFDVTDNKIIDFPVELCSIIPLKEIRIGYNNLVILPPEFSNLINLTDLNLEGNNFEETPNAIHNLPNLHRFII